MKEITRRQEVQSPWSFQTEGGIAASPIIVNSTLFFGSKDGNFYAIDINTHTEVWRYNTGNPILCQAAVLGDTIFFSSKEVYYAVDLNTGEERWTYDLKPDPMLNHRKDQWDYHDSSPVIDEGIVYFGSGSMGIFGLDAVTGKVVWEFNTDNLIEIRSTLLIRDGVIYCGDWAGRFLAIDIRTKKVLWQNKYNGAFQSCVAVKDDILIIGGRDTIIHALNIATGEELWQYKDPKGSWITGDPTIEGNIVYYPTSDAELVYAINIYDGTIVHIYPIYKNSFSKATIENGLLYITSGDAYAAPGTGKLEVFRLEQPEESLWEIEVSTGGIFTSPLIADGMIYFGSEDGCLYAEVIR